MTPDKQVIVEATILAEITEELVRRRAEEQRSLDSDDVQKDGELAGAAACYAMNDLRITRVDLGRDVKAMVTSLWPFASYWWKPTNRRGNLIKAGALIVAEIARLDRVQAKKTG